MRLFLNAAEQRNASADVSIGYLYIQGLGVTQDNVKAMQWFRKGADLGDPKGQFNVGALYADGRGVARDEVQARLWMSKAAAQGDASARSWLAKHAIER